MATKILFVAALQILGAAVIIAEFVIPSAGILTVSALASFVISIVYLYRTVSPSAAIFLSVADVFLIPVLIFIGIKLIGKSKLSLHNTLASSAGNVAQNKNLEKLVGKQGTTLNVLRPAGRAQIDNTRYDVVSTGDFIEIGKKIEVVEVDGNRIVVKNID